MKTTRMTLIIVLALVAVFTASALPAAEKGYDDPAGLARLIREGKPAHVLVDVRTPAEYETGHIPTAINVPVAEIAARPPTEDTSAPASRNAWTVVFSKSDSLPA